MFDWKSIVKPNGKPFCALTAGLAIFLSIMFGIEQVTTLEQSLEISPQHIFNIERLSSFPLVHLSWIHLLFNIVSLMAPLNLFESQHGTVYTGVMLNITAMITGLLYCIIGKFFYPDQAIAGASGWFFTLLGYFTWKASLSQPMMPILQTQFHFPIVIFPLVLLSLTTLVVPNVSCWGHLIGLAIGYFIGAKENLFNKAIPPSWLIQKIEGKVNFLIERIPSFVKYYKEADLEETNRGDYSWLFETDLPLPLQNDSGPQPQQQQAHGTGRVLGTA